MPEDILESVTTRIPPLVRRAADLCGEAKRGISDVAGATLPARTAMEFFHEHE